jgi:subtilisin family serine protease
MVRGSRLWYAASLLALPLALGACGGGGSHVTPPAASPTPFPTGSAAVYLCPSNDSEQSVAFAPASLRAQTHRMVRRQHPAAGGQLIEVTYDRTTANASVAAIAQREQRLDAALVTSYDYPALGLITRVVSVSPSAITQTEAALRGQPGVRGVSLVGARYPSAITHPYYPNDPYFNGFPAELGQASTYHVAPYDESASVPGQWDMHAIQLEDAFAYSQSGNGSSVAVNAKALGSSAVKIAIIDTGEDPTHPELQSKVVYQKCFVTSPSGSQSSSSYETDLQGHGTDVAGIAAADTNNDFGFTGTGGNVVIYGYRVFPVPDDTCDDDPNVTPGPACTAQSTDLASAIDDAVAKGVNVISISLGGAGTQSSPACVNGVDSDSTEGQAVSAAEAKNVIVVAAAGNDNGGPLEAPACDNGVIAVGASALDDGSASSPVEYVPSYSNYGSPGAAVDSASAWGIVAPGGDPFDTNTTFDADDLHWITNIWTTTPFDGNFAGDCDDDYPADSSTTPPVDCRVQIAGTSMSTPHVAGAAALILSVNSTYQSPSKMKQLLCSTADDIGSSYEGCGRLNVYRAMAVALGDPSPPTAAP